MRNIIINSGTFTAKEGDIAISSVGNVILQAAQDSIYDAETQTSKKKSWGGLKKKVTITSTTEDIRNADPVTLIGNNVSVNAGDNIISYATDIKAPTGQVSLQAGDAIRLMAVDEVDNKNVDVKKTSSFIGIKYNKSHTNDTRNVSSELPSTLVANIIDTGSGDDTYLQGTEFEYLQGANIKAGVGMKAVPDAKIIFDTINTTVQENHTREFNNVVWQSMSEKGFVDETGTLPKFTGPTTPSFSAPGGLIVQVPLSEKEQADSTNLVNVVNRMGNQPGFEYLQEIAKRQDVDFSVVQTAQKEWDYKQEGLTPAAAALISLAVTLATGGSGAGVGANLLGTTTATGSAVANAAFASLASQASVTLINNKGDVAKTLRDLGKSETIKQIAFAAVTAGVSAKLDQTVLKDFNTDSLNDRFIRGIVNGTSNALVDSAVNGTSLEEALKRSLRASIVDSGTGYVFTNAVKGLDSDALVDNIAHKLAAGLVGCASAELNKQSCEAGALGAAVGEMVGDYLVTGEVQDLINNDNLSIEEKDRILNTGKLTAASLALLLGYDVNTAANSAGTAIENNSLKALTTVIKIGAKTAKIAITKGGKIKLSDLKKLLKEEGLDIVDNLITLADGQLTLDDAKAIIDLVVGTSLNTANKGAAAAKINDIIKNSDFNAIKHVYNGIKNAPEYPKGFIDRQNGTRKVKPNDPDVLAALREATGEKNWMKVYKDGYCNGQKCSIHYFQSDSGKVFNVKVKQNTWSNN